LNILRDHDYCIKRKTIHIMKKYIIAFFWFVYATTIYSQNADTLKSNIYQMEVVANAASDIPIPYLFLPLLIIFI
jgi:hypothetical protein